MITVAEAVWSGRNGGEWYFESREGIAPAMGALNVLSAARRDQLERRREAIERAVETGKSNPRVAGGEGENIAFENGMCVMTHTYMEDQRAVVHPDEVLRLIDWRLRIMESPDFKNPDADFEPIEIEYQEID